VTVPALKEWSAVVAALLDGRQSVLLRKGGIHEKRFAVSATDFLLFPTVAHSHADRVRPEHRDLLAASAPDSVDGELTIRAAAKVVAAVEVVRPDNIDALRDMHIWTTASVRADRLDFRPRHRLTVLVVQARALVTPLRLARTGDFAGCASWVELPLEGAELGYHSPVLGERALADVAETVQRHVG
jgi:hypothetical protein